MAFVGHDAGHNAVTHNSKYDGYIGLLVNACIGIGPSWWKVGFTCCCVDVSTYVKPVMYDVNMMTTLCSSRVMHVCSAVDDFN